MLRSDRASQQIARHVANLNHSDALAVHRAERYLTGYYRERAVSALIEACGHESAKMRYRAAWSLGKIRNPAAFDVLLLLTTDPDPGVSYDAAWALGMLGDERAVEPLFQLVERQEPEEVIGGAAQGLGELGVLAVPRLLGALGHPDSRVRGTVAAILGEVGGPQVIAPLAGLLDHQEPAVRIDGVEALSRYAERTGWEGYRELLAPLAADPDANVRETTQFWLDELSGARFRFSGRDELQLPLIGPVRREALLLSRRLGAEAKR